MKNESLTKIYDIIIQPILESDVDITDKIEVLLNIKSFLDPDFYRDNVKTLMLKNSEYKWRKKDENNNK